MPGPVPGFFGFGKSVSAYILFPVFPGLGVAGKYGGAYGGRYGGAGLTRFGAVLRPRRGNHAGGLLDRLAIQWRGLIGQSAPVQ